MKSLRFIITAVIALGLVPGAFAVDNPPPWKANSPLAPDAVPSVYLAEWKKAENAATCAPLVFLHAEKEKGIKLRRTNFDGGWAVAYDAPDQRSAFGIAGTGVKADGEKSGNFDHLIEWADGSFAEYGLEGGVGPDWLAYLYVQGQGCLYNVWSKRGKEHLESLLESLRQVDTPVIVEANFPSIVRALEKHVPELADVEKPDADKHHIRCVSAGYKAVAGQELTLFWYKRPQVAADWVFVTFDIEDAPAAAWLKAFAYDRKAKSLTAIDPPVQPLPMEAFDSEAEGMGYWRTAYTIDEKGNVIIAASPDMAMTNVMIARWDKTADKFTLHKRGSTTSQPEMAEDDAEAEEYIKTVIRPNYERISANKKWAWVEKKETLDLSLEGAQLEYYYSERGLEKIVAKLFGESFQKHVEYYFINGRLAFIHDKTKRYTKYFMDEDFDEKKDFTPEERRWYIKDEACIRAMGTDNKPLPPEEKRTEFLGENDRPGEYLNYVRILKK